MTQRVGAYGLSALTLGVRCLAWCLPMLYLLSWCLALLLCMLMPSRVKVVWANVTLVYPKRHAIWRMMLLIRHYLSLGQGVIEACLAWAMPDAWWQKRIRYPNDDVFKADHDQGIIIITPHLHTFEILPRAMSVWGHPTAVVYQRSHSGGIDGWVRVRRSLYAECIEHRSVLSMRKTLKRGGILGLLPDQHMLGKESIYGPFMGVNCWTITGPIRLREQSGATMMAMSCRRVRFARCYHIDIEASLEEIMTGRIKEDVEQMNGVLSSMIEKMPWCYHWMHRRFKADSTK